MILPGAEGQPRRHELQTDACLSMPRLWRLTFQPSTMSPSDRIHVDDCPFCQRWLAWCRSEAEHPSLVELAKDLSVESVELHLVEHGAHCERCRAISALLHLPQGLLAWAKEWPASALPFVQRWAFEPSSATLGGYDGQAVHETETLPIAKVPGAAVTMTIDADGHRQLRLVGPFDGSEALAMELTHGRIIPTADGAFVFRLRDLPVGNDGVPIVRLVPTPKHGP